MENSASLNMENEEAQTETPIDTQHNEPSTAYKYYALSILTVVYAFNFVDRQILSVLQEPMKMDLGLSDTQLGLLQGLTFAIFYVTVGIPIARLADVSNRRNIVAIAIGTWSFMTALTGYAQNFLQLLLVRIGVGVGEAGGSPPSHSMISDLFKPEERGKALAIYSSGISLGIFLAFVFGGWVSDTYGWRMVFVALGVPGILLAVIVRLTLKEPKRGLHEADASITAPPPTADVIHLLFSRKSFQHMAFAAGLHAFIGYGIGAFIISFYVRSYNISPNNISDITIPLGILIAVTGLIGHIGGGILADKLGKKDKRWYLRIPAIAALSALPFTFAAFTVDNMNLSLALYVLPAIFGNMFLGPTLAMTHSLVSPRMRALASAILFFIINLIGLGLGPTAIGLLSDALAPTYGIESLRYAIILCFFVYAWCSFHYFLASKHLRKDLENVCTELTEDDLKISISAQLARLLGFKRSVSIAKN